MPTCSQITDALNTLASATTNPNVLADLSGQTAVLSNIGTTETIVSLAAGGLAVLSAPAGPAIDGLPFRVRIAGQAHFATGTLANFIPALYLGNSSSFASDTVLLRVSEADAHNGTDGNFFMVLDCIWSASSGALAGLSSGFNMSHGSFNSQFPITDVASQTDLQFIVTGEFTASDPANSVTITQFKLELV